MTNDGEKGILLRLMRAQAFGKQSLFLGCGDIFLCTGRSCMLTNMSEMFVNMHDLPNSLPQSSPTETTLLKKNSHGDRLLARDRTECSWSFPNHLKLVLGILFKIRRLDCVNLSF